MSRKTSNAEFNRHERTILNELYRARRPLSTNQVADRSDMAWQTAKKYLDLLREEGYITSAERGNSTVWWITPEE